VSESSKKIGVIVANLGTPEQPTPIGVYKYLAQFLSDKRVIDLPSFLWKPLLYGVILPLRSPRVAKLYQEIWTDKGSPLRTYTESIVDKLNAVYSDADNVICISAMSYGQPHINQALAAFESLGISDIVVLPLYPQYSATTTAVICDQLGQHFAKTRHIPQVRTVMQYCDDGAYIQALANTVLAKWRREGRAKQLVISFHGMPQRYVDAGDPYQSQCQRTASALATALGLTDQQWLITYQSRFGKAKWLMPYTDLSLAKLASDGVDSVDIICPAFAVDCLETIEEIEQENREVFISHGGKEYHYIPALNDSDAHISVLKNLIDQQRQGM